MAQMKCEVEVGEPEEAHVKQPTLASQVADAAAAQLLIFDELPADERPRKGNRVLLVGIVWGGSTLIELEQVGKGDDLTVSRLLDLPASTLPKNFQLVKHSNGGHVVTLPDELHAEVHGNRRVLPLAAKGRRVDAPFRGHAYTIGDDDRVVAQITPSLTLISRYVRAERQKDEPFWKRIDLPFASTLLIALLALAVFFGMVSRMPRMPEADRDMLAPERFARYQVKAPEKAPEPPRLKEASGAKEGEKSSEEEGKPGKPEAKKKEAAPSQPGTPKVDPNKKARDLAKVKRLGLIAALSKMGVAAGPATDVLGPGGPGAGINPSLGGTRARAGAGDAYGVGGLGIRGSGAGGGGNALGIGGLGTKGAGHGRGGYGEVDLGGRGKEETVFVPGRTTVVGGLSREVINRVIQNHYNEIKYCYEKELTKDPALYGKVTVLFLIDGTGRVGEALVQQSTMSSEAVEGCMINRVRRWVFPAPQGGGTVQVTYPSVFKSSAQ
jgi:outer membrane biosynthesis protein TonB